MNATSSTTEIKALVPISAILTALGSEPDDAGRWRCVFPERHANGDVHPSVTIKDDTATCWSQKCFEQADVFDLVRLRENIPTFAEQKKRVLELSGMRKTNGNGQGLGKIVATYDYTDEQGALLFQVVRFEPKTFRQRRPNGQGGWVWDLKSVRLVLYRLPAVLKADSVLVLEGEKDVETAYVLGLPDGWAATCNPMGAGKWRPEYADFLTGKRVVILPDADEPGWKHTERVAQALGEKAKQVALLTLPNEVKDLSDWAKGKTSADLQALLESEKFIRPYKRRPLDETNFNPKRVQDLLQEVPEPVEWVFEDYLPLGALILIAGKPKEGKTTLVYELLVNVAKGSPFLGRHTRKSHVLLLAVEEHQRDVRTRLYALGAAELDGLFVHTGSLSQSPALLAQLLSFVREHEVKLIVIDTLAAFWQIENENDASEMTKVVKPLLSLARESGACVLLIHHARKSEGSYGDEIRGSGALFGLVDVALILKRHEVQTQRILAAQSRYADTPSELVIELRENGYVALGDPSSVSKAARREKLIAALSDQFEEAESILKRAGLNRTQGYGLLSLLMKEGVALREGKGRKKDPFRYKKNSSVQAPQSIGTDETLSPIGFISSNPPLPWTNENNSSVQGQEPEIIDDET